MPSPSPASRKSTSPVALRSTTASSCPNLLASRGSHQGLYTPANSPATYATSRAVHEKFDEHKENATENGNNTRGAGRSNRNSKAPPKKPWVTHFAKTTSALSPSNRSLEELNASCSPVRSGSVRGNAKALSDGKPKGTAPWEREDTETPVPVKGVAELSKRIQQFLEDQEAVIAHGCQEATPPSRAPTPTAEPGQRTLCSPYDLYNSPFFEWPKFLRLHGNAPSMDADVEELLPLFEGDQLMVTPLQPIKVSTNISPLSTEDAPEIEKQTEDGAKDLPKDDGEVKCTEDGKEEAKKEEEEGQRRSQELPVENSEEDKEPPIAPEIRKDEFQIENLARQYEKESGAGNGIHMQVKDDKVSPEGSRIEEDADVSWGRKIARAVFCATLLVAFMAMALLASGSPGLLPPSLRNNPVSSLWHASKYHELSLVFLRGIDGLWSTELIYLPADVRVAVLRGEKIFESMKKLSDQTSQEMQLHFQVMSHILDVWWRLLLQHLPLDGSPNAEDEQDRGRQFAWIQEYHFEEEWLDEGPTLTHTDWELLHEYDLQAANQFVLGSITETLKNDLRRNISRLSDSPEVQGLLEDLMKLKVGSPEEDRLELLQYFWEYARFSASVHGRLMEVQAEPAAVSNVDGSKADGLPSSPDLQNDPDSAKIDISQAAEAVQDFRKEASEIVGDLLLPEQHLEIHDLVKNAPSQVYMPSFESEVSASNAAHEAAHETAAIADQREANTEEMAITEIQNTSDAGIELSQLATIAITITVSLLILGRFRQSKDAAKLTRRFASSVQFLKKTHQQHGDDLVDQSQQHKQPFAGVTMIEELNDRFVSVLRSPEPNFGQMRSPHAREDEDLIRSSLPGSANSPYGSFTTYKMVSKKEGQTVESKLTPVRRSSRLHSHVGIGRHVT